MNSKSKLILSLLLGLACAAPCFPATIMDSIRVDVKKVLPRFGRDSLRVTYLMEEDDALHPANPRDSGWGSTIRKGWLYAPNLGSECDRVEDLRFLEDEFHGRVIDQKSRIGDTTVISGWDMGLEERLSFSGFHIRILKTGDTAFAGAGGDAISGGGIGHVSRRAIYFDGMNLYPVAEKENLDTLVYEDPSGKRLTCTRISSILVGLTNGLDYSSHAAAYRIKRSRTIPCATLPSQCQPDTVEMVLREMNERINGYRFTIPDDDSGRNEVLFRNRADCKSYARRNRDSQ